MCLSEREVASSSSGRRNREDPDGSSWFIRSLNDATEVRRASFTGRTCVTLSDYRAAREAFCSVQKLHNCTLCSLNEPRVYFGLVRDFELCRKGFTCRQRADTEVQAD